MAKETPLRMTVSGVLEDVRETPYEANEYRAAGSVIVAKVRTDTGGIAEVVSFDRSSMAAMGMPAGTVVAWACDVSLRRTKGQTQWFTDLSVLFVQDMSVLLDAPLPVIPVAQPVPALV